MLKRVMVVLICLFALAYGSVSQIPNEAHGGIIHPCSSRVYFLQSGTRCLITCPQGDGQSLASGGNVIGIVMRSPYGPLGPGTFVASDFWLVGNYGMPLCGGAGSIDADSNINEHGRTTISGVMAAGGCSEFLYVCAQGLLIGCPPTQLVIGVHTPDLDGDLDVDLVDFALFSSGYPPGPYDGCLDYDCDGDIDLVDFSIFATHWQHRC